MNYIITNGELYHYGVKGMKWGKRKSRSDYASKARTARQSAKEWDEMAKYAEQRGKSKKAAKYRKHAAEDRAEARQYDRQAGPKKSVKTSVTKKQVSTGKKSAKKTVQKLAGDTVKGVAKATDLGLQMVGRAWQNNITIGTSMAISERAVDRLYR